MPRPLLLPYDEWCPRPHVWHTRAPLPPPLHHTNSSPDHHHQPMQYFWLALKSAPLTTKIKTPPCIMPLPSSQLMYDTMCTEHCGLASFPGLGCLQFRLLTAKTGQLQMIKTGGRKGLGRRVIVGQFPRYYNLLHEASNKSFSGKIGCRPG